MKMKIPPFKNLWDTAKAVLRVKYITIEGSLQKFEKTQIHKLTLHLKELEKEQQIKPTPSKRRALIRFKQNSMKERPEEV